jgi:hypothetical protein
MLTSASPEPRSPPASGLRGSAISDSPGRAIRPKPAVSSGPVASGPARAQEPPRDSDIARPGLYLWSVRRPASWTIADLLDFEVLLAADQARDDGGVRARDRAIFAERIGPVVGAPGKDDRRSIFHLWLEARRETESDLPGRRFEAGRQALLWVAVFAGLAVGASVATTLLHYRGAEPVNVAWFFAATVGIQWLGLAASLVFWIARRLTASGTGPLTALTSALTWSFAAGLRRLPGEQRQHLRALLATIEKRREIYGAVATWPSVVVTQLFGVCFNVGVLATLLAHVALSDVGFGWQSTLRTGPEQAWQLVSVAASPWSFLPNAHPTLEQVVASRFSYSEGIAPLSQEAMASWWPFLFYSVLVYGLLVRLLLLAGAAAASRSALGALTFDHASCNSLYRRLTGPVVQASPDGTTLVVPPLGSEPAVHAQGRCVVLVADGLAVSETFLADALRSRFGWEVADVLPLEIDHPSGNDQSLAALARSLPDLATVVVAVPARRSPIKAIALSLEKIVAVAGKTETVVLLFGRAIPSGVTPTGSGVTPAGSGFSPVTDEEFANWRSFNAIHGLHLGLERWRPA